MKPNKACPVVVRTKDGQIETLAFRHPLAGLQLVKGAIEAKELPQQAALRELKEEAGIQADRILRNLGIWDARFQGQIWSFHLVRTSQELADAWTHATEDDGGHVFEFFWHPLHSTATPDWHPLFIGALDFIRDALFKSNY